MVPDWLEDDVDVPGERGFDVARVELARHEILLNFLVRNVVLIPPVLFVPLDGEHPSPGEDDVLDVLQARVTCDLTGGAVRFL